MRSAEGAADSYQPWARPALARALAIVLALTLFRPAEGVLQSNAEDWQQVARQQWQQQQANWQQAWAQHEHEHSLLEQEAQRVVHMQQQWAWQQRQWKIQQPQPQPQQAPQHAPPPPQAQGNPAQLYMQQANQAEQLLWASANQGKWGEVIGHYRNLHAMDEGRWGK